MVGDGYCNDESNNFECDYDGGDCCGSCINTTYCIECICFSNITKAPMIDCGGHSADSCANCSQGGGKNWCNGDCTWLNSECVLSTEGNK